MAGNYHRLWHSDDIIMLVAWLEFCIKNSLDFMKSIASLSNGLYTAKQAKDKLIDLARHTYGTGCYVKGQVVLEKGMKSFSKLPANVKKDVDAAVVSFRAQYAHLLNEKAFDGHGATRPQQGQENTLTRLTGSRSLECVQENWGGKNQALQKEGPAPVVQDELHRRHATTQEHPRQFVAQTGHELPYRIDLAKYTEARTNMTGAGGGILADGTRDSLRFQNSFSDNRQQISECINYNQHDEIDQRNEEVKRLRRRWQSELDVLYAREMERSEAIQKLEAEVQCLKSDLEVRKARALAWKDPREEFESQLILKMYNLDQRVRRQEKFIGFCEGREEFMASKGTDVWTLSNQDIDKAMNTIAFELSSILLGHDIEKPLLAYKATDDPNLASLVRSCMALGGESANEKSRMHDFISTSKKALLIRTLALVALRDWVFETDFPNFVEDSPLLKITRRNVMAFGNWKTLHRLEMASYLELVKGATSDEGPEGLVSRKAQHLARQLSTALNGLFVQSPNERDGDVLDLWGQEARVAENRAAHLVEMFSTALKFKAATVTTDFRYQFVVHPIGTTAEQLDLAQANRRNDHVQYWKHATIHMYAGVSISTDEFVDALINPKNFIPWLEETCLVDCRYTKPILRKMNDPPSVWQNELGGDLPSIEKSPVGRTITVAEYSGS